MISDFLAPCPRCGCKDKNKVTYSQKHYRDKTDPICTNDFVRIGRLTCKECGYFVQIINDNIGYWVEDTILKWNVLYDMTRRKKND